MTFAKFVRLYLKARFRDYEFVASNVKAMGYSIAAKLYDERKNLTPKRPSDKRLSSKLCTQADIESDWYLFWAHEIRAKPIYHRKIWEFCYIAQALYSFNLLSEGKRALGFGCGDEPLPSLFAKYGVAVTATDLGKRDAMNLGWRAMNPGQDKICPDPARLNSIVCESVDMNHIPRAYDGGFDFCWSACSLEHLGSLKNGLAFIENSLKTLKPGGVAVHTTEFNLDATGPTLHKGQTVLYQEKHIRPLTEALSGHGIEVSSLDLATGSGVLDQFIDVPPFRPLDIHNFADDDPFRAHLRLSAGGFACTSIGLILRKPDTR